MKTYKIVPFDTETQTEIDWDIVGSVKAESAIDALKRWYAHLNGTNWHTSKLVTTFIYTAILEHEF